MYSKPIKFILLVVLLSAMQATAQNITNSPYSRYGIGDLSMRGNGRTLAMGGASLAEGSPYYLNSVNPAANTALFTQRFLYDVGMDVKYTSTQSALQSQSNCNTTFSYLMGGFAAKPWWFFTFGLKPYSSVGYSYSDTTVLDASTAQAGYVHKYSGTGGLSEVSISTAFKFLKMFSAGVNGSVIFGNMERAHSATSQVSEGKVNGYATSSVNSMLYSGSNAIHGLKYDFGFRAQREFKSKKDSTKNALSVSVGAVLGCEAKINSNSSLLLTSYSSMQNSDKYNLFQAHTDTIANDTLFKGKIEIPSRLGLGISIGIMEQLTINADYWRQDWSKFKLPAHEESSGMREMKYYGLGAQYVYNLGSPKFYKKIIYRAGIHKQETYYMINGQGIDETAVSLGVGLPIRSLFFNLSFEAGKRGTTDHGLYREKYFLMNFSLTAFNGWFIKRKFQ